MRREEIDRIIDRVGPGAVVERLLEFVTEARRARIDEVLAGRMSGVEVAVEQPHDPHNAAAVVRSAEAFGAARVHVIGVSAEVLRSKRTTAGAHHWVDTRNHAKLDDFFASMRHGGITVAAACVDAETPLEDLPVDRPICLLFGNEHRGLTPAARRCATVCYAIRTYGFAESLNLSVSAAISLYAVTSRRRRCIGGASDLTPEQAARERACCYLSSVDARLARGLFESAAKSPEE